MIIVTLNHKLLFEHIVTFKAPELSSSNVFSDEESHSAIAHIQFCLYIHVHVAIQSLPICLGNYYEDHER